MTARGVNFGFSPLLLYFVFFKSGEPEEAEAAVAAATAAVVAAEAAAAVVVVTDLTAHLGGTADRLTVNWHWRLIGL